MLKFLLVHQAILDTKYSFLVMQILKLRLLLFPALKVSMYRDRNLNLSNIQGIQKHILPLVLLELYANPKELLSSKW